MTNLEHFRIQSVLRGSTVNLADDKFMRPTG